MRNTSFAVGYHRPVYFWAGPDTVRMNRLKFMNQPVNEAVHLEAHTPAAAQRLVEAGFNWAYLMYNWGFPPEETAEQRASFQKAVRIFHEAGLRVSGYVQLSNCVYAGSHREQDWYALDPQGRRVYYYTGRYLTCWLHPAWRDQLRQRVREVVEAGADGVFLDNPWMGLHTLSIGGAWVTGAGCYCPRCQAAYKQASAGRPIPTRLDPHDPQTQHYLTWRVGVVWDLIGELADYARALRPGVVVAENVYDAINRNHYADFGVDLRRAAAISDVVMIEDHSFPRLAEDGTPVVNAITCKAARAWSGDTPVTTDPYIAGIGFDGVYTPRQFRQAVSEGAACGTATVVKGTEFFDKRDGGFTLLTGAPFAAEREALGRLQRWLEGHADLYQHRREASPLAVYFPYATLPFDWAYAAPLAFGACQALLTAGFPYRIVGPGDWAGVETIIVPPIGKDEGGRRKDEGGRRKDEGSLQGDEAAGLERRLQEFVAAGGRVVALGEERPGATLVWARERPAPTFLQRHAVLRAGVGRALMALFRAYFSSRAFRRLLDGLNVTQRVIQGGSTYNPVFRVPPAADCAALLAAMGDLPVPRVRANKPVLMEWWQQGQTHQLHLVHYAAAPQEVVVTLPWPARAQAISPDTDDVRTLKGSSFTFPMDIYTILLCERQLA